MNLPKELWPDSHNLMMIEDLIMMFDDKPLILTDELANSVYLNEHAEILLGDRAEALVNRLSFSLLGFGKAARVPESLANALAGEAAPWRGVVNLSADPTKSKYHFAEISAIKSPEKTLCGVIRLSAEESVKR